MATKLYMKQFQNSFLTSTNYFYASLVASVLAATTSVTNTALGPTAGIQLTTIAAGAVLSWISPPLASAVTIAGSITFNGWGFESATTANAGMECRVIKFTGGAESTQVIDSEFGTELGAAAATVQNWSASPGAGVAFAAGDRIVIKWYINDAGGTMASARTVTFSYGGLTGGAAGDTWIQFTESLVFQSEGEFIQAKSGNGGAGTSIASAFNGVSAAGNTIVVQSRWDGTGITVTSVSDGADTFVSQQGPLSLSGTFRSRVWVAGNIAGGSLTITVTFSATTATEGDFMACEYAGLSSSPVDNSTSATGVGTAADTGSLSTRASNTFLVGCFSTSTVIGVPTTGAGYVFRGQDPQQIQTFEDKSVTLATSYNATLTVPSDTWSAILVALRWRTQPSVLPLLGRHLDPPEQHMLVRL